MLVTGGSRRVGAAIVQRLHREGLAGGTPLSRIATKAAALADQLNNARHDSAMTVAADLLDVAALAPLVAGVVKHFADSTLGQQCLLPTTRRTISRCTTGRRSSPAGAAISGSGSRAASEGERWQHYQHHRHPHRATDAGLRRLQRRQSRAARFDSRAGPRSGTGNSGTRWRRARLSGRMTARLPPPSASEYRLRSRSKEGGGVAQIAEAVKCLICDADFCDRAHHQCRRRPQHRPVAVRAAASSPERDPWPLAEPVI